MSRIEPKYALGREARGMIPYDLAAEQPLNSDALIQTRVSDLVGRAVNHQLWLLFLDSEDVQLPVVLPLDELPVSPPREPLIPFDDLAEACGATQIVAVVERYGDDTLTQNDVAWAKHLRDGCAAGAVQLRALLLSHSRGVRWIAPEDYAL